MLKKLRMNDKFYHLVIFQGFVLGLTNQQTSRGSFVLPGSIQPMVKTWSIQIKQIERSQKVSNGEFSWTTNIILTGDSFLLRTTAQLGD